MFVLTNSWASLIEPDRHMNWVITDAGNGGDRSFSAILRLYRPFLSCYCEMFRLKYSAHFLSDALSRSWTDV